MSEQNQKKSFWKSSTGWIIKIAGIISAITVICSFIIKTVDFIKERDDRNAQQRITALIKQYYALDDQNNYQAVSALFSDPVDEYYEKSNFTRKQIMQDCVNYYNRWPFHKNTPDYSSLKIQKMENGNYFALYQHMYKIKRKKGDDWKNYTLQIKIEFSGDYLIKSISEQKM
ncbi:hypothetical protein [Sediminibacterium ginsengisoli]|uniref:DUF4829 domain-containing protein n=1 Tax=Sediminibacterium ginsengisoli TaxID=413434 RepID=A0A1T4RN15_9BACT|nr:hypothetical protein [Sediminibacterium ginsengisoli]SKA17390.1 hypothetical protein SAMN04488132_11395 [Sediminibacterium ginsengisoli]